MSADQFGVAIASAVSTTSLIAVVGFLSRNWLIERLKASLQKEHARFLDALQWERKTRERAEKVAEYLALARTINPDSSDADFRKAEQLAWELAMWLPEDIYRAMSAALRNRTDKVNELSVVIAVRKLLLNDQAGSLTQDDVLHHPRSR